MLQGDRSGLEGTDFLAHQAAAPGRTSHPAISVAGLARFFPEAAPVRLPVKLARIAESGGEKSSDFSESTVIEFGTPHEVLFACSTQFEFGEDRKSVV